MAAIDDDAAQEFRFIELIFKVFTFHDCLLRWNIRGNRFFAFRESVFQLRFRYNQLVVSHLRTCWQNAIGLFQFVFDVEKDIALRGNLAAIESKLHCGRRLRPNIDVRHNASHDAFAVGFDVPFGIVFGKVGKEILIRYFDCTFLNVNKFRPDILIEILHFVGVRIENSVGRDETVAVEVVVGGVVVVVVAAVGVFKCAVGLAAMQRLVYKVPNEAALQLRIFANQVPILLETAARVAHSV